VLICLHHINGEIVEPTLDDVNNLRRAAANGFDANVSQKILQGNRNIDQYIARNTLQQNLNVMRQPGKPTNYIELLAVSLHLQIQLHIIHDRHRRTELFGVNFSTFDFVGHLSGCRVDTLKDLSDSSIKQVFLYKSPGHFDAIVFR
jgi:hypothetical protein